MNGFNVGEWVDVRDRLPNNLESQDILLVSYESSTGHILWMPSEFSQGKFFSRNGSDITDVVIAWAVVNEYRRYAC